MKLVQYAQVTEVIKHPNANILDVLKVASEHDTRHIITNQKFKIGDRVIVGLPGYRLSETEQVKVVNIRGINSHGMLLTDWPNFASEIYERFQPWGKTKVLADIYPTIALEQNLNLLPERLAYRGKIKLHGTNAGITITPDGKVIPQSKKGLLTPTFDNYGFARWTRDNHEYFQGQRLDVPYTIYGEWCGPRIQKGMAVNQLNRFIFAVFALKIKHRLIVEPEIINTILANLDEQIYILPWQTETYYLGPDAAKNEQTVQAIDDLVEQLNITDPWVKSTFGLDGRGEGYVFFPATGLKDPRPYIFKSKIAKLRTRRSKQAASLTAEQADTQALFLAQVITSARLEQGVEQVGLTKQSTKEFIEWIWQDVLAEDSGLFPPGIAKQNLKIAVENAARIWFLNKCNTINF